MKPALVCALALCVLTFSAKVYNPSHPPNLAHAHASLPLAYFWGIANAESSFNADSIGPDGLDRGLWQFRATFDKERGIADPFDPIKATRAAVKLFTANLAKLKSVGLAVTAHKRGAGWAKRNGIDARYLGRVKEWACQTQNTAYVPVVSVAYPAAKPAKR
jgi:hypothetical protein